MLLNTTTKKLVVAAGGGSGSSSGSGFGSGSRKRCFYYYYYLRSFSTTITTTIPKTRRSTSSSSSSSALSHLILLRHGQSLWNKIPTFTGWCNVPLTEEGKVQAMETGKLLKERGYENKIDIAFTSKLQRAYITCELTIQNCSPTTVIQQAWQLNERHYGALQGRAKNDPTLLSMFQENQNGSSYDNDNDDGNVLLLQQKLKQIQRGYYERPPPMNEYHPYYEVPPTPKTESLQDCQIRVVDYFENHIVPYFKIIQQQQSQQRGSNVLIVAHSNTLRGLIAHLDNVPVENIPNIHIPNSVPCLYHIDIQTGKAIDPTTTSTSTPTTSTTSQTSTSTSSQTNNKSKGLWMFSIENYQRLSNKIGLHSESFLKSIFTAWDSNQDGILTREEIEIGLYQLLLSQQKSENENDELLQLTKSSTDDTVVLSLITGKIREELNNNCNKENDNFTLERFQSVVLRGLEKNNLPIY